MSTFKQEYLKMSFIPFIFHFVTLNLHQWRTYARKLGLGWVSQLNSLGFVTSEDNGSMGPI